MLKIVIDFLGALRRVLDTVNDILMEAKRKEFDAKSKSANTAAKKKKDTSDLEKLIN